MLITVLKGASPDTDDRMRQLVATPDISVFATTFDVVEACLLGRFSDAFIVDYTAAGNVLATIQRLSLAITSSRVVVFDVPDDPVEIVACLESGALGYVRTSESGTTLINVLRDVNDGNARLDSRVAPTLIARLASLHSSQPDDAA